MLSACVGLIALLTCVSCRTVPPATYTEAHMKRFWETNVRHHVMGTLHNGVPEIPEIDAEVKFLCERIKEVYGTRLTVRLETQYCRLVPDPFDAYVAKGVPTIEVSIPALIGIDAYSSFIYRPDVYESYILVHLSHQLYRLAYGLVATDQAGRENKGLRVERLQRSWGITCERMVVVLIEKHNTRLFPEDEEMYELWIRSMHSTQMPLWDDYMRRKYLSYRPP